MTYKQPFDLEYWFVNVFAGGYEIFIAISLFILLALSAYFRMPIVVTIAMFVIFVGFISFITELYMVFFIIIIGGFAVWSLSRIFKR